MRDKSVEERQDAIGITSAPEEGISRRLFLGGVGAGIGGVALAGEADAARTYKSSHTAKTSLPMGAPLRVLPVLAYATAQPQDRSSWRPYGAIHSPSDVVDETRRIEAELRAVASAAEFPIEFQPVALVCDEAKVRQAAGTDVDALLVYASGGDPNWFSILAASKAPNVMFIRHKSGPYYLYHEIAHWRFLRRSEDVMVEPNASLDDIVVDDYAEVLWRLRALYGLKNARGTKMLAVGSLAAYSGPGQEFGPKHAREIWNYSIEIVSYEDFKQRLGRVRSDGSRMREVEHEMKAFLGRGNVTLKTERRFVENSFVALQACRRLLHEKGAFNIAFDRCMGRDIIEMLDTPPCLLEALINDEGYTSYCHTDLTHTVPGVLLRWIAGKPTFVCNTHLPHDGVFTVAHCAAPMRMNGREHEPTTVLTHYESDYGAATKVEYRKDQEVTVVVPNLHCTRWHGFKGTIIGSPSLPACRSQMDIRVNGDCARLAREMEGFHAQIVYGDYLREVGYALKKTRKAMEWKNYSEDAGQRPV